MRTQVWFLSSISGLKIRCCYELWCRSETQRGAQQLAAAIPIWSLVWEPPYATKKRKKKKKKKEGILHLYTVISNICVDFTCFILHFTFSFLSIPILLVLSMTAKLCISFSTKLMPDKSFSCQISLLFFFFCFPPSFSLFLLSFVMIFSNFKSGGLSQIFLVLVVSSI